MHGTLSLIHARLQLVTIEQETERYTKCQLTSIYSLTLYCFPAALVEKSVRTNTYFKATVGSVLREGSKPTLPVDKYMKRMPLMEEQQEYTLICSGVHWVIPAETPWIL